MIGTSLPVFGCFHERHRYLLVRCFSGDSTGEGSRSPSFKLPVLLIVSAAFGRPRVSNRIDLRPITFKRLIGILSTVHFSKDSAFWVIA